MNTLTETNQNNETVFESVDNKIINITKNDLGRIFKKLEPNAFQYDIEQRTALLHSLNTGNRLSEEDYVYIAQTYSTHSNELLPKTDEERDNPWIIPVTLIYALLGIVLRLLLIPYKQPVLFTMSVLSILAVVLALFVLSGNINTRICSWISQSVLLDVDKKILQSRYRKTRRRVNTAVWLFVAIDVIVQVVLFSIELLDIGNDINSIIAFGIAFFSDNVESFVVKKVEEDLKEVKL